MLCLREEWRLGKERSDHLTGTPWPENGKLLAGQPGKEIQTSRSLAMAWLTEKPAFSPNLKTHPNATSAQLYSKVQIQSQKRALISPYLPHRTTEDHRTTVDLCRIYSRRASIQSFLFHFYFVVYKQDSHSSWPRQSCICSLQGNERETAS